MCRDASNVVPSGCIDVELDAGGVEVNFGQQLLQIPQAMKPGVLSADLMHIMSQLIFLSQHHALVAKGPIQAVPSF